MRISPDYRNIKPTCKINRTWGRYIRKKYDNPEELYTLVLEHIKPRIEEFFRLRAVRLFFRNNNTPTETWQQIAHTFVIMGTWWLRASVDSFILAVILPPMVEADKSSIGDWENIHIRAVRNNVTLKQFQGHVKNGDPYTTKKLYDMLRNRRGYVSGVRPIRQSPRLNSQ